MIQTTYRQQITTLENERAKLDSKICHKDDEIELLAWRGYDENLSDIEHLEQEIQLLEGRNAEISQELETIEAEISTKQGRRDFIGRWRQQQSLERRYGTQYPRTIADYFAVPQRIGWC